MVDQEQERLGIVLKIARGDELAVAGKIDKAKRGRVDHPQKPCRPAAMLDIGLAVGIDRGQKDAGAAFDKRAQVIGDHVCQPAASSCRA